MLPQDAFRIPVVPIQTEDQVLQRSQLASPGTDEFIGKKNHPVGMRVRFSFKASFPDGILLRQSKQRPFSFNGWILMIQVNLELDTQTGYNMSIRQFSSMNLLLYDSYKHHDTMRLRQRCLSGMSLAIYPLHNSYKR